MLERLRRRTRPHLHQGREWMRHGFQRHGLRAFDAWLAHPWRENLSLLITMGTAVALIAGACVSFLLAMQLVWTGVSPVLMGWFGTDSQKQFIFAMGLTFSCFVLVSGWRLLVRTVNLLFQELEPHHTEAALGVVQDQDDPDPMLRQRCQAMLKVQAIQVCRLEWRLAQCFWNQTRMLEARTYHLDHCLPPAKAVEPTSLKKPRL